MHVRSDRLRIFMQVIRPENRKHMISEYEDDCGDIVLCLNELKMGIIAQSVINPGTSALIMNIIASFADNEDEDADGGVKEIEVIDDNETGTWLGEYERGCDWEIYVTALDKSLVGLSFAQMSLLIYQKKGIVVFGIRILQKGTWHTLLNPATFVIPENSESTRLEVFVLAKNAVEANLSGDRAGLLSSSIIYKSELSKLVRADSESKDSKEIGHSKEADLEKRETKAGWQKLLSRFKRHNCVDDNVLEQAHEQRDIMEKDMCFINDVIPDMYSVTILTSIAEEFPSIKDHTVIIGKSMGNIHDLVYASRQKIGNTLRPIVIMFPEPFPLPCGRE